MYQFFFWKCTEQHLQRVFPDDNSLYRAVVFILFVLFCCFFHYVCWPVLLSFLFDFSNNCFLNPTRATYLTRESKKNTRHVLLRENKALSRSTWLPYYDVIQSTDLDTEPRQRHNHFDHCPPAIANHYQFTRQWAWINTSPPTAKPVYGAWGASEAYHWSSSNANSKRAHSGQGSDGRGATWRGHAWLSGPWQPSVFARWSIEEPCHPFLSRSAPLPFPRRGALSAIYRRG